MEEAFRAGFGVGLSLILAIGAQNAFVLRQGILRRHVFAVALFCALSDAVLISAGVAGAGVLAQAVPGLMRLVALGGAIWLGIYGARAAWAACRGGQSLRAAEAEAAPLGRVLATCAALTWANPHVYLDTLVLLGTVSAGFGAARAFGAGAICASFVFFFTLAYGARLLVPLFRRPVAWRVLDGLVALVMWAVALSLVLEVVRG